MECPDGKLYPVSAIKRNPVGRARRTINFSMLFDNAINTKFDTTLIAILLFLISTNDARAHTIIKIVPPNCVISLITGVSELDIKCFDMKP